MNKRERMVRCFYWFNSEIFIFNFYKVIVGLEKEFVFNIVLREVKEY